MSQRIPALVAVIALVAGCAPDPAETGLCALPDLSLDRVESHRLAIHIGDSLFVIEGGERRSIPGATGLADFDWGNGEIFFVRRDSLYRVGPGGVAPISVPGEWNQVRFPAASPGGERIALSVNQTDDIGEGWELAVLNLLDGSVLDLGHGYDASWLPDGSGLVYEVHVPGPELMRRALDSPEPESLRLESDRDRTVEVSPDGGAVVFTRGRGGLMLHSLVDGTTVRLTGDVPHDRYASFASDGSMVVFFRQDESDGVVFSIVACELATGRTVEVERGLVQGAVFAPTAGSFDGA